MKKFTLFLSALLISAMSFAAEATISFENVVNRTVFTSEQQVWEQNGLVVTNDKAASTNAIGDYYNPVRFYKGSSLTIKCTLGNITKIVIDGNAGKPVAGIQESIGAEATLDGNIVTVVPNATSDTYTIAQFTAQVRVNSITVTYADGNGGNEDGEDPELIATSLAWSATTATATIGGNNTYPTLTTTPANLAGVTYKSSNIAVATIAADGTISLVAAGTTTITASFAATATHAAATDASYTLTVKAAEQGGEDDEILATVVMDFTGEEGLEKLGIAYPTTDAGDGAFSTNLEEGKAYSQNGVSLTAKHGSTATRVWLAASGKMDLRHYKGGVLTFAAPAGKVITQVVFDGADLTGLTTLVDKSWTGTATVVEIPAADDAKTIKINTITISLADAAADFVATPAIAGETDFMDKTTVTITAEDGLKVYYTLDGTEPTNASTEYTAPFELTATTTVKAVAYDGDKASAVVEKTFTKMSILTCTEAVALCTATATTESYIVRGYVTEMIEAYNDKYKNITFWMADAQDGGQVLQAFRVKPVSDTDQEVKAGDYVEVVGTLVLYTKDDVSTPEINAGGSVKILEAAPTTAIDNVTVDQNITKFFENGQLVIIKNGVRYNAQGAVVK